MRQQQNGFTIIEVVLFLAVSGLLTAMLLASVGASIQRQQYRDAVQSFASFIRSEYAKVVNVENDRSSARCPVRGANKESLRGQDECVIVGRYVSTTGVEGNTTGTAYASYAVYAAKTPEGWKYQRDGDDQGRTYQVDWGAKTKFPHQGDGGAYVSLLLYRQPDTGSIVIRSSADRYGTRVRDGVSGMDRFVAGQADIQAHEGAAQVAHREICVYDTGWFRGERLSVFISQRAGSANAITVEPARECTDA